MRLILEPDRADEAEGLLQQMATPPTSSKKRRAMAKRSKAGAYKLQKK